jgi:hypothetical protein
MPTYEVGTTLDVEKQKHTGVADVSEKFDGHRHWNWAQWKSYTAPTISAAPDGTTISQLYPHRDILNRKTFKPKGVLRYLSPTHGKPTGALIQATRESLSTPSGNWRRRELEGNAPKLLRICAWVIQDLMTKDRGVSSPSDWAIIAGKVLVAAPLLLLMVNFLVLAPNLGTKRPQIILIHPPLPLNQPYLDPYPS